MAKVEDISAALQVAFDAAEELGLAEELGKKLIELSKSRKKTGRVIFRELLKEDLAIHCPPTQKGNLGFFKRIIPMEGNDRFHYYIAPGDQVSICQYEVEETVDSIEIAMQKMIDKMEEDGHSNGAK